MAALSLPEDYITAIAKYEQELGIRPGTLCASDLDLQGIVDLWRGSDHPQRQITALDPRGDLPFNQSSWSN